METNFLNKFSGFTETERIALRKKVLLFGFFLFVSVFLWLLIALGKQYDDQIPYPVNYKNFPESKVLIGDLPDHLILDVKASGFTLLRYRLSSRYLPISFSVNSFKMNRLPGSDSSSFYIETRFAEDHISSQLSYGFIINKILPDTLIFRFGNVSSKVVPVISAFRYQLGKQLILKNPLSLNPDSVMVSGPDFLIDTINAVLTQNPDFGVISKNSNRKVQLSELKYVYVQESEVKIGFEVEKFTEKNIRVPVEIINLPESIHMQAFPRYVQLICQVGLSNYEKLEGSMFRAQVDYTEIASEKNDKLKVTITKQPAFIQVVRYSPKTVEFIIEK